MFGNLPLPPGFDPGTESSPQPQPDLMVTPPTVLLQPRLRLLQSLLPNATPCCHPMFLYHPFLQGVLWDLSFARLEPCAPLEMWVRSQLPDPPGFSVSGPASLPPLESPLSLRTRSYPTVIWDVCRLSLRCLQADGETREQRRKGPKSKIDHQERRLSFLVEGHMTEGTFPEKLEALLSLGVLLVANRSIGAAVPCIKWHSIFANNLQDSTYMLLNHF